MVHSVLAVADGAETVVHLLHGGGLSDARLADLSRMADRAGGRIVLHSIGPERLRGLPGWGRIPVTMWHRIFVPELLPDVERVLYLDVDTIVLAPITPLFELDLSAHHLAAVTNVPELHMLGHAAELGLPGPEHYFNSGVLVMNLALMRGDGTTAALCEFARAHAADLLWPDQDALNVVLGPTRHALHPRWNAMNSVLRFPWAADLLGAAAVREATEAPAIVHFEGPGLNKPWHLMCHHPFRERYFEHRRATPWPRCRRTGVTPPNLARLAAQHFTARRAV
jgi:lipopolysaccharide biosynthesis glycosyltransferase